MGAIDDKKQLLRQWTARTSALICDRNNLTHDDLQYVMSKVSVLKDERLKSCIADLIGWGDEERAELVAFCATALTVMEDSPPSRLRDAVRKVEMRYHLIKSGVAP